MPTTEPRYVDCRQAIRGVPPPSAGFTMRGMSRPSTSDLLKIHIGRRLRVARAFLGIEQRDMAKLMGIEATTLSNYENGIRLADTSAVLRLLRHTDFTPNFILGGLLTGMDFGMRQRIEELASEHQACLGGPVPEWPMAIADHERARPPAATQRRPPSRLLHEGQASLPPPDKP